MGDVIGDLNSRRGRVESMEDLMGGAKQIKGFAHWPTYSAIPPTYVQCRRA